MEFSKLFKYGFVLSQLVLAVYFSLSAMESWSASPIVTSVSMSFIENIPFPAVTICSPNERWNDMARALHQFGKTDNKEALNTLFDDWEARRTIGKLLFWQKRIQRESGTNYPKEPMFLIYNRLQQGENPDATRIAFMIHFLIFANSTKAIDVAEDLMAFRLTIDDFGSIFSAACQQNYVPFCPEWKNVTFPEKPWGFNQSICNVGNLTKWCQACFANMYLDHCLNEHQSDILFAFLDAFFADVRVTKY